jgi:hypothetical protein
VALVFCLDWFYGAQTQIKSNDVETGKMILANLEYKLKVTPGVKTTSFANAHRCIDANYSKTYSRITQGYTLAAKLMSQPLNATLF